MNRDVLVIGGGIAGMQSALLLAEKNHHVYILDTAPAIGGFFPLLDRTFPTDSCGVCFMSPRQPAYCPIYETDLHENIEILTNCDVDGLKGEAGDFEISYTERPRYIDTGKCTLCDRCTDVCPVEVETEFGQGLEKRKAVYLPFSQAIPRSYVIDEKNCTKCCKCVKACPVDAINLDDSPSVKRINAGAIVLAFGFEPFQARDKGEFGLGRYKNVVSSIQYERMISHTAPTGGVPRRPSDGKIPERVAFIQCVGSRDISCNKGYCSSICCMYAIKQAVVSKSRSNDLDAAVFYMDVRAVGKGYERYYGRAKDDYGVRFLRSTVSTIREFKRTNNLLVAYGLENGILEEEEFDMVVLSVGFTPPESIARVADKMSVALNEYGFCETQEFKPTQTSVPGIFVAGAFRGPRDIPETVVEGCSAASDVSALLDKYKENKETEREQEQDRAGITKQFVPRIGVFICEHKGMLSESLNIKKIAKEVDKGRNVVCVEKLDVGDRKKALREIEKKVKEKNLNRVVLAGYRGREIIRTALKNKAVFGGYTGLFEHVNIGEQCAAVHREEPEAAEKKALNLIETAIGKARLASPRKRGSKPVSGKVLVVGGGVSGLSSSLALAEQGMDVTLVEKEDELGGNARNVFYTTRGTDVQAMLQDLIAQAENHPKIEIIKNATLADIEGSWGKYHSVVSVNDKDIEVNHGAVIFAVGAQQARPDEYLFGENENVVTQRTFEHMLAQNDSRVKNLRTAVMIQCVGSRDDKHSHCSRVCCSHAVKNALKLKETNPETDVYVLYRDMRTYGFAEKYYQEARAQGCIFVRYDLSEKPEVFMNDGTLSLSFLDRMAGVRIELDTDMIILSTGVDTDGNRELAELAGLQLNGDGFFAEANVKAAPLDSAHRGKYFCGLCHSSHHIEEAICQGKAAASRASALLWNGKQDYSENISRINEMICSGCGTCVAVCPYNAISLDPEKLTASVDESLCKGCGTCAASCRASAIDLDGFSNEQMLSVLSII
jgi:heterodisulfide reductase subunit A